jgi:hypothetical protein
MIPSRMKEYTGFAAQTLMDDDTMLLEVVVPEFTPMATGTIEVGETPATVDVKVENAAENGKSVATVKPAVTVTCEYFGDHTNRSRPNIHIGEPVRVVNIGNTAKFYWLPRGTRDDLRTTEHCKIHVSNKAKQTDELTDDTAYFVEMDTREGKRKIHIHTSKGTKESVEYDIRINTDASTVEIIDSEGNGWKLDSLEHRILSWNKDGSYYDMNKENITHVAPDTYKIQCKHYVLEAEDDIATTTKKTTEVSTDSIAVTTKEQTVTASTKHTLVTPDNTITSPISKFSGGITVGAFIGVSGAVVPGAPAGPSKITGDVEMEGNLELTGDVEQTGDLTVVGTVHGTNVKSDTAYQGIGHEWVH